MLSSDAPANATRRVDCREWQGRARSRKSHDMKEAFPHTKSINAYQT